MQENISAGCPREQQLTGLMVCRCAISYLMHSALTDIDTPQSFRNWWPIRACRCMSNPMSALVIGVTLRQLRLAGYQDTNYLWMGTERPVRSLRQMPRATASPASHVTPTNSMRYGRLPETAGALESISQYLQAAKSRRMRGFGDSLMPLSCMHTYTLYVED